MILKHKISSFSQSTIEKMEAISDECPKGSICHATRGLASSPNVSSTNFKPVLNNQVILTQLSNNHTALKGSSNTP